MEPDDGLELELEELGLDGLDGLDPELLELLELLELGPSGLDAELLELELLELELLDESDDELELEDDDEDDDEDEDEDDDEEDEEEDDEPENKPGSGSLFFDTGEFTIPNVDSPTIFAISAFHGKASVVESARKAHNFIFNYFS